MATYTYKKQVMRIYDRWADLVTQRAKYPPGHPHRVLLEAMYMRLLPTIRAMTTAPADEIPAYIGIAKRELRGVTRGQNRQLNFSSS